MKAKNEPTQRTLGGLYNQTDKTLSLMICVQNACHGVRAIAGSDVEDDMDGLSEGLSVAIEHLRKVKAEIHDLVAWAVP